MKILILGSRGFIGSQLLNFLKKEKKINISSDSIIYKKKINLQNKTSWKNLKKYNLLINLANMTDIPSSWNDSHKFIKNNFLINLNALEYCKKNKCKYISLSSYLYKYKKNSYLKEDDKLQPSSPYHLSLYLNEKTCLNYNKLFGVKSLILRVSNVYGYGQNRKFLIPQLFYQADNFNKVTVLDIKPRRNFIYIDDVLQAIKKSIFLDYEHEVINIASENSYSVHDIIKKIKSFYSTDIKIINKKLFRKNEIKEVKINTKKAQKLLKWKPEISINEGLKNFYEKLRDDIRN